MRMQEVSQISSQPKPFGTKIGKDSARLVKVIDIV